MSVFEQSTHINFKLILRVKLEILLNCMASLPFHIWVMCSTIWVVEAWVLTLLFRSVTKSKICQCCSEGSFVYSLSAVKNSQLMSSECHAMTTMYMEKCGNSNIYMWKERSTHHSLWEIKPFPTSPAPSFLLLPSQIHRIQIQSLFAFSKVKFKMCSLDYFTVSCT